ncbi:MAG: hypothetical protein WCK63_05785 [Betaproteobacteria bacterium]
MPGLADFFALCAVAAACAGALTLAARRRLNRTTTLILFSAFAATLLVPFGGLPIAAYIRGFVGDPSFSLLALIAAHFLVPQSPQDSPDRRMAFLVTVSAGALLLYPLALGAGAIDPYRWGFNNSWFLASLLSLGLIAHVLRWPLVLAAISLAIIGWSLDVYASRNLWDYLLDPLLALYALLATTRWLGKSAWRIALVWWSKAE